MGEGNSALNKSVVVIDYGAGNVFSVCNALKKIGMDPILTNDTKIIKRSNRLILPGVGAFSQAIANLKKLGIDEALHDYVLKERPLLGICLGMQLLMERSFEFGVHIGLGIIRGDVKSIKNSFPKDELIKVPHVGWAKVDVIKNTDVSNIKFKSDYYYFVHSFVCRPTSDNNLIAETEYNTINFAAIIGEKNIIGVQFHPEKSGRVGLEFLEKFVRK